MIGVDWGTSSFRAYRLRGREIADRRSLPLGILSVADGRFEAALQDAVGAWLADGERRILLSGMIGSRQGWIEAPYLPCPAGIADLARALIPVPFEGAEVLLAPGLTATDASGVPEVMRGEEVQIIGAVDPAQGDTTTCLPGSHSKWVRVVGAGIEGFSTHLTGEAFAGAAQPHHPGPADAAGRSTGAGCVPPRGDALGRYRRAAAPSVRGPDAWACSRSSERPALRRIYLAC